MKHLQRFFLAIFGASLLVVGCQGVSDLESKVSSLESRVSKLETLCSEMNTNISSLQTIVAALQQNDYVTSVSSIEGGYAIAFAKNGTINIYNGQDGQDGAPGQDGSTPTIGVAQDTDGYYYWTLNGEWLLDSAGNKVIAQGVNGQDGQDGAPGQDGVTPQLKIEDGNWYVSVDSGATWALLGQATGDKGDQGDAMFKSVTYDDDFVYFTLSDDTLLTCPRKAAEFTITFDDCDEVVEAQKEFEVKYTLSYGNEKTTVEAIANNLWQAEVVPTDATHGVIKITSCESSNPADGPYYKGKVVVIASDGDGKAITKTLIFENEVMVVDAYFDITAEACELYADVTTNLEYNVEFWEGGSKATPADWIELVSDTKAVRTDKLTFKVAENNTGSYRSATVMLMKKDGSGYYKYFWIDQSPARWKDLGEATFAENLVSGFLYDEGTSYTNKVKVQGLYNGNEFYGKYVLVNPYAGEPFASDGFVKDGEYKLEIAVYGEQAYLEEASEIGLKASYDIGIGDYMWGECKGGKITFTTDNNEFLIYAYRNGEPYAYYGIYENGYNPRKVITIWLPDYEPMLEEHLSENFITYDGKDYPVNQYNGKWWFCQNLAYLPVGMVEASSDPASGTIWNPYLSDGTNTEAVPNEVEAFGYLYSYDAIFGLESWDETALAALTDDAIAAAPTKAQGICPKGWHVPSAAEYYELCGAGNKPYDTENTDAVFWNAETKYASLENAYNFGWLNFWGSPCLPGYVFNGAYNKLIVSSSNSTLTGLFVGNHSMNYWASSTYHNYASNSYKFWGMMTTFTLSKYPLGRMSIGDIVAYNTNSGVHNGVAVRCVRN